MTPAFINFTTLWPLWLILPLASFLVLLYFLKLKRPRVPVPSLVLWKQVVNDNRVNSPFQRFKRNILLWLQLILLLLLIFALMEPIARGGPTAEGRLPILIDRSASMAARDADGVTRLDLAKQQVEDIIDGLNPDEEVALIAFGKSAQQVTDFTSDKRVLRAALEKITIEDVPSEIGDGLRMVEALARQTVFERVLLISDGNFPAKIDFALPFQLDYQKLPPAGPNMGITALNARRAEGGGWNVFVSIQATQDAQYPATLELIQDGESRGTERVSPIPGRSQRIVFGLSTDKRSSLELRLLPEGDDSLANDNVAFMELAPLRPLWVWVSPGLARFRAAVAAIADVRVFPEEGATAATATDSYDLIISDATDKPEGAEWQTALYVGVLPEELEQLVEINQGTTEVIDWMRRSQLLEHVELTDVVLLDQPTYKQVTVADAAGNQSQRLADRQDLENEHYEVLAFGRDEEGRESPLILHQREGQKQAFYLLFHTDRSTLPYRIGFPILAQNIVRLAMFEAGLLEVSADRTGVLPPLSLTAGRSYDVEGPEGVDPREEQPDENGSLTGVPAPRVGQYTVSGGGLETQVAVSLLQPSETTLETVERIDFDELSVTALEDSADTNRALWTWFALAALAVLLLEWWFFQRKPGGFRK